MHRPLVLIIVTALIFSCDTGTAFSKGGRGKGGGRVRSTMQRKSHSEKRQIGSNTRVRQTSPIANRPTSARPDKHSGRPTTGARDVSHSDTQLQTNTDTAFQSNRLTGRDHSHGVQRFNERRKLEHRLQTADHLRQNAERNGNQNLLDTADRMEARAYQHYESKMSRIDGRSGVDDLPPGDSGLTGRNQQSLLPSIHDSRVEDRLVDPTNVRNVMDVDDALGNDAFSFDRRFVNEERKLQHQLDVAQRLRDIAARNGNENLIGTAERMEQMAITRYDRQLEKLTFPEPEPTSLAADIVESLAE
jgi:hypothetical protein